MKKLVSVCLVLMMVCSLALAETVYVSISDGAGKLVVAYEPFEVTDTDADGAVTLRDALAAAHDAAYEGGAEAGFATENTEYGISLMKLWGVENGGSYGYYVNNLSPLSLLDPVSEGDHVQAYAFTDLAGWSDTFCFFDFLSIEPSADFELTLTAQGYDADWNPVYIPIEGAMITINGVDSGITTDAEGKAIIDIGEAGEYLISARSDSLVLVPPVCSAKIG